MSEPQVHEAAVHEPPVPDWTTLTGTVQGVNKPRNQDFHHAEGRGTAKEPLILAVADGHGSAAHARSSLGARFAVDTFTRQAEQFGELAAGAGTDGPPSLAWLLNHAQYSFPRRLVSAWRKEALGNWERLQESEQRADPAATDEQKLVLYGTTLIGAVLTPQLFAAWQLGDGDLTLVGDDGRVESPLAPVEAELGDETESLCSRDAWRLVRMHWAPVTDPSRLPRLVALSTDGLSKSFASDRGFTEFMTGLGERLSAEGTARVREVLPEWLAKAAQFSGDDTTLVAARRCLPPLEEDG
ncbi:protein phosphatase 2C domain-containing protein [Streptomyces sp. NBC_01471]|uniref:protein phosphatase 2C domain-containing protein n=1 Tax=Streptomyces sp. NBC_01471 TaxID=2903879 RepID=UPI003243424A